MSSPINWNEVIRKEARGSNDEDLGEIHDISNGYVFVQKGMIHKEKLFIPKEKVESYDGEILRFNVSREEAASRYQGDVFPGLPQDIDHQQSNLTVSDEMTIPLIGERLEINKIVEEDQATITKKSVTETKTIEVDVTHEEVSFERRKPTGDTSTLQKPITSKQVIEIPLKGEEIEVVKTPYIKEEIVVKKRPVTEIKEFTGKITTEQVNTTSMQQ